MPILFLCFDSAEVWVVVGVEVGLVAWVVLVGLMVVEDVGGVVVDVWGVVVVVDAVVVVLVVVEVVGGVEVVVEVGVEVVDGRCLLMPLGHPSLSESALSLSLRGFLRCGLPSSHGVARSALLPIVASARLTMGSAFASSFLSCAYSFCGQSPPLSLLLRLI